jgi:hypothetical protein
MIKDLINVLTLSLTREVTNKPVNALTVIHSGAQCPRTRIFTVQYTNSKNANGFTLSWVSLLSPSLGCVLTRSKVNHAPITAVTMSEVGRRLRLAPGDLRCA